MGKCLHMQQPSLENLPRNKKSSAESSEASGEIGGAKAERGDTEAVMAQIEEKEKTRDSLMKSWKTKFDGIRAKKAENDKHKETITRLHMNGKLSDESYQAELDSMQEGLDADMRDAQKDLDLATEFREEIEKLKA